MSVNSGCSSQDESVRVSASENTEIALIDVPSAVTALISDTRPEFNMEEVVKKVRDGRVYYDVEGTLPAGDEIEFDVLMTETGPQIVEIQRDIIYGKVPEIARKLINGANTDKLEIARIIESVQTDKSVIYEIFVSDDPSDPRFEVQVKNGQASLLKERWEH